MNIMDVCTHLPKIEKPHFRIKYYVFIIIAEGALVDWCNNYYINSYYINQDNLSWHKFTCTIRMKTFEFIRRTYLNFISHLFPEARHTWLVVFIFKPFSKSMHSLSLIPARVNSKLEEKYTEKSMYTYLYNIYYIKYNTYNIHHIK